jgi:hypothetical protein
MRKVITVGLLVALLASIVVASASPAVKKPTPWQWTPQKVVLRLTAAKPIDGGEIGGNILSARCTPKGRGVAGRYSRFTCDTRYGGSNGSYTTMLSVRVLPVGSGKLCIVTVTFSNLPGEFFALDASSGKPGPRIKPEFACPTA